MFGKAFNKFTEAEIRIVESMDEAAHDINPHPKAWFEAAEPGGGHIVVLQRLVDALRRQLAGSQGEVKA